MKLIVGLGNPEDKYTGTRHNVGFWFVKKYTTEQGITLQYKDKFKSQIAEISVEGEKVILTRPMTYYNLSGKAVRAIADFYKIETSDILVIHDELALPFGTVRTRKGGADAGNNGVKSITAHMGEGTARIRIGVDGPHRQSDTDFVLGKFTKDETETLKEIEKHVSQTIDTFIKGTFYATTRSSPSINDELHMTGDATGE